LTANNTKVLTIVVHLIPYFLFRSYIATSMTQSLSIYTCFIAHFKYLYIVCLIWVFGYCIKKMFYQYYGQIIAKYRYS
jgi:hypothetical protein